MEKRGVYAFRCLSFVVVSLSSELFKTRKGAESNYTYEAGARKLFRFHVSLFSLSLSLFKKNKKKTQNSSLLFFF